MSDPDATPRKRRRTSHAGRRQPAVPRISREARERMIAQAAVMFFAEHGFDGQTRELARRLGITQPLLYSYFPNKAALIDRVYREVFLDRWKPQWQDRVADRSRPLPERLTRFYQDYANLILSYEWVRLFMFSGLKGLDITKRYCEVVFGTNLRNGDRRDPLGTWRPAVGRCPDDGRRGRAPLGAARVDLLSRNPPLDLPAAGAAGPGRGGGGTRGGVSRWRRGAMQAGPRRQSNAARWSRR